MDHIELRMAIKLDHGLGRKTVGIGPEAPASGSSGAFEGKAAVPISAAWRQARRTANREAELVAAIEAIREETWKPGQTLPKLRLPKPLYCA
jgi:hypothetical protein